MIMRGELSIVGRGHVRLRRATTLLVAAIAPLCWLATAPGPAQASVRDTTGSTQTVTVADSAEAWYAAAPIDVCTTPLGCPPPQVPTSPYPADTLHVGVAGGQESARTYLLPDFTALPLGATLVGGEMTLPVAGSNGDGTVSADAAKIRACLATKPVPDGTQGSTSAPPAVNCDVSTTPRYDSGHSTFTLDLQPFIDAWTGGQPRFGIALEPDSKAVQPTDAWHVAFNGRKRAGSGHSSSSVTVHVNPEADTAIPAAPTAVPAAPAAPVSLPAPAAAAPAAVAPVVAPTQQPQTLPVEPVAFSRPFQYPLAFLLPLVLLAAAVFFSRLFTRDVTPVRTRG
jgi:hypothetical protein